MGAARPAAADGAGGFSADSGSGGRSIAVPSVRRRVAAVAASRCAPVEGGGSLSSCRHGWSAFCSPCALPTVCILHWGCGAALSTPRQPIWGGQG